MSGSNALTFIDNLDSAFIVDPAAETAFRLQITNLTGFQWTVSGDNFSCVVDGVQVFSDSLSAYTVRSLAEALSAIGFQVSNLSEDLADLSASVIMDGTGSLNDPVLGFTSAIWAIGESMGVELQAASDASDAALLCAALNTATSTWLDLWGSYFGIPRNDGELDPAYATRIVVEVLRPRCNNIAIGMALSEVFGQTVTVTDALIWGPAFPLFDGATDFDGTHTYQVAPQPIYGEFDVGIGYDLLGGVDPLVYLTLVTLLISKLKAAGTYLRNLSLTASEIEDTVTPPVDHFHNLALTMPLTDTVTPPNDDALLSALSLQLGADPVSAATDSLQLTITYLDAPGYAGTFEFDGTHDFNSGAVVVETF